MKADNHAPHMFYGRGDGAKKKEKLPVVFLGFVARDGSVSIEPPEWFIKRLGPAFDDVLGTESTRKEKDGDEPDKSVA